MIMFPISIIFAGFTLQKLLSNLFFVAKYNLVFLMRLTYQNHTPKIRIQEI